MGLGQIWAQAPNWARAQNRKSKEIKKQIQFRRALVENGGTPKPKKHLLGK